MYIFSETPDNERGLYAIRIRNSIPMNANMISEKAGKIGMKRRRVETASDERAVVERGATEQAEVRRLLLKRSTRLNVHDG